MKVSDPQWWCVQGLSPSTNDDPLNAPPEEQEWHTVYHAQTHGEGRRYLRHAFQEWFDGSSQKMNNFLDFRLRPPITKQTVRPATIMTATSSKPVKVSKGTKRKKK